ncbi:hypothetical protein ACTXT7_015953 [Hymenolepis weldensis]
MLCSRPEGPCFFVNAGTVIGCYDKESLAKKAGCIAFTPNEQSILLGEKSGYVFCIPVSGSTSNKANVEDQDEVLGHLSLLTSVVASSDGRYIGTCDRDEKIRISRFSQPFVLESFCLGHTKMDTFAFGMGLMAKNWMH